LVILLGYPAQRLPYVMPVVRRGRILDASRYIPQIHHCLVHAVISAADATADCPDHGDRSR